MSRTRLFIWSAQDKNGIKRLRSSLAGYVQAKAVDLLDKSDRVDSFMSELAYALSARRSRLQWKMYGIASTPEELVTALADEESPKPITQSPRVPRVGFVFTGQGAQWPRMGAELVVYEAFRESIMAADHYLQRACGCLWSVTEELQQAKETSQVYQAEYSHAMCTVLQVALVDLLRAWDVLPTAVVGHSGGETAAAYSAGYITREDAWKIAYHRGRLAASIKSRGKIQGSMMAVGLSADEVEEWVSKVTDGHVVVACINSPTSTTISGDSQGIVQLLDMLKETGVFARKLLVDTAYHSPHMEVIADEYKSTIADVKPITCSSGCSMHSSVTGSVIEPGALQAQHWINGLVSAVRFSEAVSDLISPMKDGVRVDVNAVDVLVEVGPHSALQGPSTQSLKAMNISSVPYHSALTRNHNAVDTAVNVAGVLFSLGYNINIREVNGGGGRNFAAPLCDIPSYSWNHSQRFWHESRGGKEFLSRNTSSSGLLGMPIPSVANGERLWKGFIRHSEQSWTVDHKIQGAVIYPGAGYIAMALEAATQIADVTRKIAAYKLRDIQLTAAAIISDGTDLECTVQLRPHLAATRDSTASTWTDFMVSTACNGDGMVQNCHGLLELEYEQTEDSDESYEKMLQDESLKEQYSHAQNACVSRLDPQGFYADMRTWGLDYGPTFANVCEVRNDRDGQSVGSVQIPDIMSWTPTGSDRPHIIHPGTLDAVFHLAFAAVKGGKYDPTTAMVPNLSNLSPFPDVFHSNPAQSFLAIPRRTDTASMNLWPILS
ncbi:hypothetical protein H634G_08401, partial [Metarhizium anisopliae BRIP 53293]